MPIFLCKGRTKTITKLFVAENGLFETPFLNPQIPLIKFMWVPFCVLSQEMRHINFFLWGPKWGVWGGGQKVYVEKVYVLFPSPI